MKSRLGLLGFALLAGVLAFTVCFYLATRPLRQMAARDVDGIAWLMQEFHLSGEQAARVQALHDGYEPRCEEMCRKIAASNARLEALISGHVEMAPEIEAAIRESAELQIGCRREMLGYIYSVAAVMPAGERERYLSLMKPRVLAPGLPHDPAFAARHHHP